MQQNPVLNELQEPLQQPVQQPFRVESSANCRSYPRVTVPSRELCAPSTTLSLYFCSYFSDRINRQCVHLYESFELVW